MRLKKAALCSLIIISFLFVQSPAIAQAKYYAAAQGSTKITQNAPQIKTTPPEPIAAGKTGGSNKKVIWGVLGVAALVGLIAAVVGGGSSGGGGGDDPAADDTGSVQVEW